MFGVLLGVLVLGESLTLPLITGALGIVLGVACMSWKGDVSRTWPLWALALPIGAALLRTLAQMFAKIGMESIPSPCCSVGLFSANGQLIEGWFWR